MKHEACIRGCKYNSVGTCELYHTRLEWGRALDPIEDGDIVTWLKCGDCREKELSCAIDEKVRDIYSFYHAFTQEMDMLFNELEGLVVKREDIYKQEN